VFVHLLQNFCPPIILNMKFGTDSSEENRTDLQTTSRILSVFSEENTLENSRCILTVLPLCSLYKVKDGAKKIQMSFVFFIYRN